MDMVAEKIKSQEEKAWFSTVDSKHAQEQVPLLRDLAKHCNAQIKAGKSSGTYRFDSGSQKWHSNLKICRLSISYLEFLPFLYMTLKL